MDHFCDGHLAAFISCARAYSRERPEASALFWDVLARLGADEGRRAALVEFLAECIAESAADASLRALALTKILDMLAEGALDGRTADLAALGAETPAALCTATLAAFKGQVEDASMAPLLSALKTTCVNLVSAPVVLEANAHAELGLLLSRVMSQ